MAHLFIHIYRQPTKLREGNVFSRVCHSVNRGGGPHVSITHDALNLTIRNPQSPHTGTPPHMNMFKLVQLGPHSILSSPLPPPPDMFKLIHYGARTAGKRAVGILFECFLVFICKNNIHCTMELL